MISPTLFGYNSYDDIVDALRNGNAVESQVAGIRLKPVSKETFKISTLYRPNKHTRKEKELEISFRLTVRDLMMTVRSAACEQFLLGEYDGFQVVTEEGVSIVPTQRVNANWNPEDTRYQQQMRGSKIQGLPIAASAKSVEAWQESLSLLVPEGFFNIYTLDALKDRYRQD